MGGVRRANMRPDGKKDGFKQNDKLYVFYDKEEFYNIINRFLFLSRSDSLDALSLYLGIPSNDVFKQIKNCTIPLDWVLRMGFRLYEMVSMIHFDNREYLLDNFEMFEQRYKKFRIELDGQEVKKLALSVEKALLFSNPLLVDETTRKYLNSLDDLLKKQGNRL